VAGSLRDFEEAEEYATRKPDRERLAQCLDHLAEMYRTNGHEEPALLFAAEAARLRRS
jgi:hypothetical protein